MTIFFPQNWVTLESKKNVINNYPDSTQGLSQSNVLLNFSSYFIWPYNYNHELLFIQMKNLRYKDMLQITMIVGHSGNHPF